MELGEGPWSSGGSNELWGASKSMCDQLLSATRRSSVELSEALVSYIEIWVLREAPGAL